MSGRVLEYVAAIGLMYFRFPSFSFSFFLKCVCVCDACVPMVVLLRTFFSYSFFLYPYSSSLFTLTSCTKMKDWAFCVSIYLPMMIALCRRASNSCHAV